MSERVIDFPAADEIETARLSGIISNLAEHYHKPVRIEKVTIMRVNYEGSCIEMDIILKQLAGDPAGFKVKRVYKNNKHKALDLPGSKPYRPSESQVDKSIDPLGS